MACVVRYVWRKNSQPKLMALVPYIKADCEVGACCLSRKSFIADVVAYPGCLPHTYIHTYVHTCLFTLCGAILMLYL